jgi:glycerol-3-phosphate O-acyltransferase
MNTNKENKTKIITGVLDAPLSGWRQGIASFVCRKAELDDASVKIIKEYSEKGAVVFASFQSSNAALLMLQSLFKRNDITLPKLALEYNPFMLQTPKYIGKRVIRKIQSLFRDDETHVFSTECISNEIKSERPVVFSMLSDMFFLRRYMEKKYDSIYYLIEIQKSYDKPIYIIPQTIFWTRKPEKQQNAKDNNWKASANKRSVFALLSTQTPSYVHVADPVNLQEFIAQYPESSSEEVALLLRDKLIDMQQKEDRIVLGPVLAPRNEMMERVLYHPNVRNEIARLNKEEKTSRYALSKKALKYYKEIAADFQIGYIHFLKFILNYIFKKIYKGMIVGDDFFNKVKEAAKNGPVVLVPCHRSHMDYLILSYLFYLNRVIPPHIAAGVNLSFFPLGTIFRHSGAFFIRRTFKGLKLYPTIFRQYVKTLMHDNYQIEFFIEGGRTRTGRLVAARPGLLSFVIEAIDEGYAEDATFVPISINYDRVLEEGSYYREIKGKEKKSESVGSLLSGRKFLKKEYGHVYIEAGDPFTLSEVREGVDFDDLVPVIGKRIMIEIGKAVTVSPVAFTTLAMLLQRKKGFSLDEVVATAETLYRYLVFTDAVLAETFSKRPIREIIEEVMANYVKDHLIEELEDEDIQKPLYVIGDDNRQLIAFYKNSIQHYFLPLFVLTSIIKRNPSLAENREEILALYESYYFYLENEFILIPFNREIIKAKIDHIMDQFIIPEGLLEKGNPEKAFLLDQCGSGISDILEAFYITFSTLEKIKQKSFIKNDLLKKVRETGTAMKFSEKIEFVESVSVPVFKNTFALLLKEGAIEEKGEKKKTKVVIKDRSLITSHLTEIRKLLK